MKKDFSCICYGIEAMSLLNREMVMRKYSTGRAAVGDTPYMVGHAEGRRDGARQWGKRDLKDCKIVDYAMGYDDGYYSTSSL